MMLIKLKPSAAVLRRAFFYNPRTGVLQWSWRDDCHLRWNKRFAYKPAGNPDTKGYLKVGFTWKAKRRVLTLKVAHIAWIIMTGKAPTREVDHIDLDRTNNKWRNLRLASTAQNCQNQTKRRHNTSGFKGVCWHKTGKGWTAQICHRRKSHYLGLFNTPEEAAAAYLAKAKELHGEFHRV
jgi:hypothetical protein